MKSKVISLLIILLFILSTGIANAESEAAAPSITYYYCPHVIDGDTIIVIIDGNQEKVRLIGVDTPEKDGPYTKEEPFNKEASSFTRMKAQGKKVTLKYDWQKRDKYGRLLAYVYLKDGTFLNAELIKQGNDFIGYESKARKSKKGLWKLF